MLKNIVGNYRGYILRRATTPDGPKIIAVQYDTDANGRTLTRGRLTGDYDNTIEAKNAIDRYLGGTS